MQPFTLKTLYSIVISASIYFALYYLFAGMSGWSAIILRSGIFALLFAIAVFALNLTPDAHQLLEIVQQRIKKIRE